MSSSISRSLSGWNCPIHGGFSNVNRCAWPDCPHGVESSSLDVEDRVLPTETFHRVSWRGQDGNAFHDWRTNGLPKWFSLSRVYGYFAEQIVTNVDASQMFHYTSADGALAILQSGCLRFTDYAYLNDTREVSYGLDVIRSILDADTCAAGSQALTKLKDHIGNGNPFSPYNIYTASFSSDSDSLSQFRLYGSIALGFEANLIGFGHFKGDVHIGHVVYDLAKQVQLIETFFDLLKQSEEMDSALIKSDETRQISTDSLISDLLRIAALFKHPAFSDEKEMRILYSEPLEIMDKFRQEIAHRQFKVSGGLIVPFTDTFDMIRKNPSDEGEQLSAKLPLKSVVIGPTPQAKALANGMRDLLSTQGYHDVEVSLSEAPLRS